MYPHRQAWLSCIFACAQRQIVSPAVGAREEKSKANTASAYLFSFWNVGSHAPSPVRTRDPGCLFFASCPLGLGESGGLYRLSPTPTE